MKQSPLLTIEKTLNLVILLLLTITSSAQENLALQQEKKDHNLNTKVTSPHSLLAGIGYGSNMIYMGSNVSQDKPYYSGSLTYGYKDALYISLSTNHLTAFDPFLDFSALSVSYNHDFNSWFDISTGISRYQVNRALTDTLFNSFFYGYLTLGFDWNILYTSLSAAGLFSQANGAYFNLRNSRYIQISNVFNGKASFYFDPYVTMLFGTLTKTVTAEGTTTGVSVPFKTGKSSGGNGGNSSGSTTTFFSLMEVDFGLPFGSTIGKFTIEAEPGYILPGYSDSETFTPKGFTFLLNCYLKIF